MTTRNGLAAPHATVAYLCLEAPREGQASYVHTHEIIQGLERHGWVVDLIAPRYSKVWKKPNIVLRMWEYLRMQLALAVRLRRYDVIYVRAHPLAWPLVRVAGLLRRPVVHEVNGTYGDIYVTYPLARAAGYLVNAMQRDQYRRASALVTVTDRLAEWLRHSILGDDPPVIRVIPNGANVDLFTLDVPRRAGLPETYVVFFGGLFRWHGIDDMLTALASPEWPEGVSLVVVGDGPEITRMQQVAEADRRLVLLGRLNYREVPGVVASSMGGLIPITDPGGRSTAAGVAPLKLFETMACGVPAVASDLPGQGELVRQHGCGLVYPPGDGVALARAVATLAGNPSQAREMGRRGRQLVCEAHSWARRAADTDSLLRDVLGRPHPPAREPEAIERGDASG